MGIVRVKDYLLGHFNVGDGRNGRNRVHLKSMLILGFAGAGVAVALRAIISLLLHGSLTVRDLLLPRRLLPRARL